MANRRIRAFVADRLAKGASAAAAANAAAMDAGRTDGCTAATTWARQPAPCPWSEQNAAAAQPPKADNAHSTASRTTAVRGSSGDTRQRPRHWCCPARGSATDRPAAGPFTGTVPTPVTFPGSRRRMRAEGGPALRDRPLHVLKDGLGQKSMSPPPGAAGAFSFSGFSAMTASVVRNSAAIDAAFCSADRVTLAGSIMPASNMLT